MRLPGFKCSAEDSNGKRCQNGGETSGEMEHLDNLHVGELTAAVSLYPFWVRFKEVLYT